MKKLLFLILISAIFTGCSKSNDTESDVAEDIAAINNLLNGRFVGSLYSSTTNSTETEEITFNPYSTAREMTSFFDGKIKVHGSAVIVKYFDDHLLKVTKNCYYSVNVVYKGAQPTISFYPYSSGGEIGQKETDRKIVVLSENSFQMGDKTFKKQ